MHKKIVFSVVARILFVVSVVMLIPLGWALKDGPASLEVRAFLITILSGSLISMLPRIVLRTKKEDFDKLNAKDGLAIVGLSWFVLSLFGALPLFLTQSVPTYTDAFFETVSGFTTTGATVLGDIESYSRGILFWRSLTHWLGGMGIIVLYLALLPALGQNAFQLYKAEAPGITAERIQPRIKETAKILWAVYFLLSALETGLLMLGGMSFFDALCHTFGTMATGGFSTKNASIGAYSPYIQWVVIVFMFLAGTNFMLHYQALRGNLRAYFQSEEFRSYFFLMAGLVFIFTFILKTHGLEAGVLRAAAFQVVSIFTTTGYVTADFNLWPPILGFLLVTVMFIGGCGGSTGGGMKVTRAFIAVKVALRSVVQAVFPNAVLPVRYDSRPLDNRIIMQVLSYFVIYMFLFCIGTIVLIFMEGCDIVTGLSAAIATLSNIGPGLGLIGATKNYAWISVPGKLLLSFLMLAGRLELYSILVLFSPLTWRK